MLEERLEIEATDEDWVCCQELFDTLFDRGYIAYGGTICFELTVYSCCHDCWPGPASQRSQPLYYMRIYEQLARDTEDYRQRHPNLYASSGYHLDVGKIQRLLRGDGHRYGGPQFGAEAWHIPRRARLPVCDVAALSLFGAYAGRQVQLSFLSCDPVLPLARQVAHATTTEDAVEAAVDAVTHPPLPLPQSRVRRAVRLSTVGLQP